MKNKFEQPQKILDMQGPLMTPDEVASYLRISRATVYSKRTRRQFPEGTIVKLFGKLLFKREKIEQLVEEATEDSFSHS